MKFQDLARVDMIVRASRWERVKLFFRYASSWTVMWTLGAIAFALLAFVDLVVGKGFPWSVLWVVVGAAAAIAVDVRDPYQRLALLGGPVLFSAWSDNTVRVFGKPISMCDGSVQLLVLLRGVFERAETDVILLRHPDGQEWKAIALHDGEWTIVECRGSVLSDFALSRLARRVAGFLHLSDDSLLPGA